MNRAEPKVGSEPSDERWGTQRGRVIKSQINGCLWIDKVRGEWDRERDVYSFPLGIAPSWRQLRIQEKKKKKSPERTLTSGGWPWLTEEQWGLLVNDFQRCCLQSPRCFLCSSHSGRKAHQAEQESDFYTDCTGVWGWILDRGFLVEESMWGQRPAVMTLH